MNYPIVDMSGCWFTPLIAAVNLGVPYFNADISNSRFQLLKQNEFKVLAELVGINCQPSKFGPFLDETKKIMSKASKSIIFIFILT